MPRPIRIEYPGAVYHVITRGNNRQRIFKDDHDRSIYLEKLYFYCEEKEVKLLCYGLLSNHIHLLVETPQGNLSKMMQPLQTSYTVYFNRRHHHTGHVFEQRYKAFLVDKDNYLLEVSRYIHLNPVGAGVVKRPENYRWSSYRAYIKGQGVKGLDRGLILGQFGGRGRSRVTRYRDFVEGGLQGSEKWSELPVIKQAFVGDEDFAEQATRRAKRASGIEGRYRLAEIVPVVCRVMGIDKEELRKITRESRIQEGREVLMYMARRYSESSLREITSCLGVRDLSTVSHGVRRAEERLRKEHAFCTLIDRVLKKLSYSRIQA